MIINSNTLDYPLSAPEIIAGNPHISFPIPFELPDGHAFVLPSGSPEHDPDTQRVEELTPVQTEAGWRQAWVVIDLTEQELAQRATERAEALVALRQSIKDAATAKRWEVESGGIVLPDGTHIKTEIDDQNRVSNAALNATRLGLEAVKFKRGDGSWADIPLAVLVAIADAIALHVQACFAAECAHHEAIDALADEDLASYDVTSGWPG